MVGGQGSRSIRSPSEDREPLYPLTCFNFLSDFAQSVFFLGILKRGNGRGYLLARKRTGSPRDGFRYAELGLWLFIHA